VNFNSPEFALFFPTVLVLYALLFRREKPRDLWLLAASYFFYMSWNWKYAGLLLFSTALDYFLGLRMAREERPAARKSLVTFSVVVNLGLLGVFKYYNFFLDVARDSASLLGRELPFDPIDVLLPVGISFYTFQSLSYTIDIYRRQIEPERDFAKFALFVSFFPQLVAGPIVRAVDFLPQLHRERKIESEHFREGLFRVFRGLFKKVVLADLLANFAVDEVFADPSSFSSLDLLLALYGYAFQIYNDFSGYSDVAIGASRMMGFEFPENFNRPYLAQNVREFWTRWHISLSTWLRDYLYIPLGGNRGAKGRTSFNLLATMLLGGLWHGAAMNFVLWGAYHGALLMFARSADRHSREKASWALVAWRRVVCFHLVLGGWLLFRVSSLEHLGEYVRGLVAFTGGTQLSLGYFAVLVGAFAAHFSSQDGLLGLARRVASWPAPVQGALYAAMVLGFCALTMQAPAFIYFQF
jgi:alginate O-acetyltransferase complex protein AlgI